MSTLTYDELLDLIEIAMLQRIDDQFNRVETKLDSVLNRLGQIPHILHIVERLEQKMATLDELLANSDTLAQAVAQLGTDTTTALDAIRAAVDALRALVATGGITPEQQAQIDQIDASLTTAEGSLAATDASIVAAGNDPGSPVPPPEG